MFDISFPELIVVGVIALLVLGPDNLPGALRTLGLWVGRMRRTFVTMKTEIEREIGMDEIRRQLHNEAVMEQMKRLERDVRGPTSQWLDTRRGRAPETPPANRPPAPSPPSRRTTLSRAPEDDGESADGNPRARRRTRRTSRRRRAAISRATSSSCASVC